ncbi:MAG: MoaD/ThiS family protein, partial [Actinobacteria bacterium]|nr:MoaD/ThiS family protein [Actinomycetota bacterium]
MSHQVRIPTQLRSLTGDASVVEASGGTISEVVDDLDSRFPGVKERLMDGDTGKLRRFVNVYLGDEDVRFMQGIDTPVPEGARLSIIPAVAGGAPTPPGRVGGEWRYAPPATHSAGW